MGSEISIGNELAQLKVSLGEFTTIIKHLSGEIKHQEVRQAIKEMIQEVRKSYDTVVDVYTPLYSLDTEEKFKDQFPQIRTNFKNRYLKDVNEVRTRCTIVADKLVELKKQKGWMKNLPYLSNRSFKRLDELCHDWIANDLWLARNMEYFLRNMKVFFDQISKLQKKSSSDAFQYLELSLDQYEDDFQAIKKRVDYLTVISNTL